MYFSSQNNMVKLFVGNLAECVDTHQLKQIFSQFAIVTECDVLKNYAFVHVDKDSEADEAIKRLNGYVLEGKTITVEKSTSRLRTRPGMQDKCFRCGASDHKTVNCPDDEKNQNKTSFRIDLTGKRPTATIFEEPAAKRPTTHGYFATQQQPQPTSVLGIPQAFPAAAAPQPVVQQVTIDPEIARPNDAELIPLYEQYIESRTRYSYYRDRLIKEIQLRQSTAMTSLVPQPTAVMQPGQAQYSSSAVSYVQPGAPPAAIPGIAVAGGSAPYQTAVAGMASSGLRAPYAVASSVPMVSAPYAQQPAQLTYVAQPTGVTSLPSYGAGLMQPSYGVSTPLKQEQPY